MLHLTVMRESRPASVLDGKYVIGELIGEGGMGRVYRAVQTALHRTVAVKVVRADLVGDRRILTHFRREAIAAARAMHPNLVMVLDTGDTDDGRPLLVMEYVQGRALGELVRTEPLSITRACDIVTQVLSALAEVHRADVVHADVKTDNVLVETTHDGGDRVRLLDFGLAHISPTADHADQDELAHLESIDLDCGRCIAGTPEYMAPEVINGGVPTPATDLYGVGVILYELLTGTTPFAGGDTIDILKGHLGAAVVKPSVRCPDRHIPSALERVVERALAKAPGARHADADTLATAIAVARAAAPIWCSACATQISPECGYCQVCSASMARASAATGRDVDTLVWRPPHGVRPLRRGPPPPTRTDRGRAGRGA